MKRVKNIKPWLFLLFLLIIPTGLFTVVEVTSLSDQEQMIEAIYANQLDAVLYSINQYADDMVSSWSSDIHRRIMEGGNFSSIEQDWPQNNPQVEYLNLIPWPGDSISLGTPRPALSELDQEIRLRLQQNFSDTHRLFTYLRGGYRKIAGIDLAYNKHLTMFIFAVEQDGKRYISALVVDARRFISEVLSPRMQAVAGDQLVLTVRHHSSGEAVFSSDFNTVPETLTGEQAIWLLPDYFLGIQPIGMTIRDLARQRAMRNIGLIILVDLLLLIGALFFYRSVRRESRLAKIKSDFVSNVSHEIRTPLSLISMYAETLQMGRIKDEGKRYKYYDIIYREAQRLSGIVNNILNFSRIETGRRKFHFSEVDVNEVISSVLENYHYHLEKHHFQVEKELDQTIKTIEGDREAITESVINLIDNAIKYSDEHKWLKIQTGLKGAFIYIEIIDKGVGIPQREQTLIFDKFYRVTKGALAHHAKGSGLGLSIVHFIMQAHHGRIEVDSKEGNGSTFRLLFPIDKISKNH